MTYEGAIFVELGDNGLSGCMLVVGANSRKKGHSRAVRVLFRGPNEQRGWAGKPAQPIFYLFSGH